MGDDLSPGSVVWIDVADAVGREQSGRRPWVVLSTRLFLMSSSLVTVIPCTTAARPWRHRIELTGATGLSRPTYAITEQVRTVDRERIVSVSGLVDDETMRAIATWVHTWLHPAA